MRAERGGGGPPSDTSVWLENLTDDGARPGAERDLLRQQPDVLAPARSRRRRVGVCLVAGLRVQGGSQLGVGGEGLVGQPGWPVQGLTGGRGGRTAFSAWFL
jgi:hypothetical protein